MLVLAVLGMAGCNNTQAKEPTAQALPVQTKTVNLAAVPRVDEYVATVKSRRSATIQPQVDGTLTRILVKSGDHVRAGQLLMTIDPLKQQATVDQQHSTEAQKKAVLDFNKNEVERQRRLFESGVTSKRDYEAAVQAYENSKADWEASTAARVTQQRELDYYNLTAPVRRRGGRYSSPRWRLCFAANTIDHSRRKRPTGSLHLYSLRKERLIFEWGFLFRL